MLDEYKEILRKTVRLANLKRTYYDQIETMPDGPVSIEKERKFEESVEGKEFNKRKKALNNYLESLDFETIKVIQTIMYLGRDQDYNNDSPEEIYRKYREYFDGRGWNTQRIETHQMTEKLPLDKYLADGLKILNMEL